MNSDVVVDTSAVIPLIMGESTRKVIRKATIGSRVFAPASVYWEVGKVLLRTLKERRITKNQLSPMIESFLALGIEFVDVSLADSVLLAYSNDGTGFDAYVLQCAKELKLPLLTLDNPMKAIALSNGIPVVNL